VVGRKFEWKAADADDFWKNDSANYGTRVVVEMGDRPQGVALKRANAFKLYDMLGKVWQWTADWYAASYEGSGGETDPQGAPSGESRVVRGGSWINVSSYIRVSILDGESPGDGFDLFGFRCAGGDAGAVSFSFLDAVVLRCWQYGLGVRVGFKRRCLYRRHTRIRSPISVEARWALISCRDITRIFIS
jgi:hypothetical protein